MDKRIAFDGGFRAIKALDDERKIRFHQPSVVGIATKAAFSLQGAHPFSIRLKGQQETWYVGNAALTLSQYNAARRDADWVFSDHYRVLMCAALSELCAGRIETDVNMVTGLPISDYERLSEDAKEKVFLGRHLFERDGQHWQTVNVNEVTVVTQPFGSLADMAMDFGGKFRDNAFAFGVAGVADIGGNTFNLLVSKEMQEVGRWSAGDGLGLLKALSEIAKDIHAKYPGIDPKPHEIASWIAKGTFPYGAENFDIAPLADPHLAPLAELIISRMAEVWTEPKRLQAVLLTGGGALVLGDILKRKMAGTYPETIIADDAVFANVRGYLKLSYYLWPQMLAEIRASDQAK